MKTKIDFDIPKILNSRGLGGNQKAQKHLASEVKKFADP